MSTFQAVITDFVQAPTKFVSPQTLFMDWIVAAHVQAESVRKINWSHDEQQAFGDELSKKLWHVGCKPDVILQRGHTIADFLHKNWSEMEVYRLGDSLQGIGMQSRQHYHQQIVESFFDDLYGDISDSPGNMIHVSCTGYASPSAAQKTISKKGWQGQSTVTHVYHMGCYGSLPAVRIGEAFVCRYGQKADIIHTELCSLHMNPLNHSASQLVSQSLFADGCIKYSIHSENKLNTFGKSYLRIIGQYEHLIPGTLEYMQWVMGDAGFHFVLAKEIPVLISKALDQYLKTLCAVSGIENVNQFIKEAVFAVHPGGPKILDYVQKAFSLEDEQIQTSRDILKNHGNMSSATLPHIWEKILDNHEIKNGTKILSMAFGPGLTIAGAILEKIG